MRIILFLCLLSTSSFGQQYAIGGWKTHFPLNKCIDIAQSEETVYAASNSGLIILDKTSSEISMLTKAEGLMDVEISTIYFSELNKQLIIAYKSGGIDIYQDGVITSFLDIVRSTVSGSKAINKIKLFYGKLYLCTDFGVVVFDDNKKEVQETYYIGANGDLSINDLEFFNDSIYVATKEGVFAASANSNLANSFSWEKQNLPYSNSKYDAIFLFHNTLFSNLNGGDYFSDTLFQYKNFSWIATSEIDIARNKSFQVSKSQLLVANDYGMSIYDSLLNKTNYVYRYTASVNMEPANVIFDNASNETIWCADRNIGLVKNKKIWNSEFYHFETVESVNVVKMEVSDNQVWSASGGISGSQWQNVWLQEGVSYYDGLDWKNINKKNTPGLDTIFDFIDIAIDPTNKNHVYVATLGDGLLEFENNQLVSKFNTSNSTLQPVEPSSKDWYWIGVSGVTYDYNANLWVANHSANKLLSVFDKDGVWHAMDLRAYTSNIITGDLIVTSNNQVWLMFPKSQGILIYEANNTFDNTADDNGIMLTQNNGLPSNTVFCVAEDIDGEIWIGTDKGIGVVYDPKSIFTSGELEAKKILIEQDGYTEYLFENNSVTSIAVDGANRKWVGTRGSGVFLLSADGMEQILAFTKENSPLPSNEIKTIAINQLTGEVFIGTEKGIVSYRSDAVIGNSNYNNISIFPNPVRESYSGPIAINGLEANSSVKITDTSGNIVFENQSLGGQAIWDGNNFEGIRVATGVYLVFCTNTDGTESEVSKILLIN